MTEKKMHNLFGNYHATICKAVKSFLQIKTSEKKDKLITTTLRIPEELKKFYECLSKAEMTSINTAIVSTLSKVKDQTISEYYESNKESTYV